ncbi:MAG: cyclic nucleotide-binding domain-containing protein [Sulfuritalea sp.]|nr:cyclic nucleotide-binding domain-containing protein [Sulfuritalea sp.]
MTAPSVAETLRLHPPFDRFEPEALSFLDQHLHPALFPAGAVLVSPEQGAAHAMFIIARGKVQAVSAGAAGAAGETELTLAVGECFPIGALSGRRASANVYTALTEVEAWLLPAAAFHQLLALSPAFSRHCTGYLASLVSQSRQQLQAHFAQQANAT